MECIYKDDECPNDPECNPETDCLGCGNRPLATDPDPGANVPLDRCVMPTEITKGEWLRRCAARFIEKGGVDEETAEAFAETCLESTLEFEDFESTPEECADGEMSYWTD